MRAGAGPYSSERSRATAGSLLRVTGFTSEIQAPVLVRSHLRETRPSAWNSREETSSRGSPGTGQACYHGE